LQALLARFIRKDVPAMQKNSHLFTLTELVELPVHDSQGETVGTVEDLVLDADDNRIAYVSLVLRSDSKDDACLVTVPWSAVALETGSAPVLRVAARHTTLRRIARRR
jgi:sporulation protein YlmC with PRC-barrel domain